MMELKRRLLLLKTGNKVLLIVWGISLRKKLKCTGLQSFLTKMSEENFLIYKIIWNKIIIRNYQEYLTKNFTPMYMEFFMILVPNGPVYQKKRNLTLF